jgi:hypothetical protein
MGATMVSEPLLEKHGREREYTLVWSNSGPVRASVTLKSEPILLRYVGKPFFQRPDETVLTCYLYRIVSFYPDKEYYTEQLSVQPERFPDISLAFRAHYSAYTDFYEAVRTSLARFESIPDYFAVWKNFAQQYWGYGFAADSHIRNLDVQGSKIQWRLQVGHNHRCVHYFMWHCFPDNQFDAYHQIGHSGWYESVFKPLQSLPLNRYVSR